MWLVGAIVGVSFVVRTGLAWMRATPALFPDEYIYASVGRSFAESGRPLDPRRLRTLPRPAATAR